MAAQRRCPKCGEPLPAEVVQGTWPACLLREGLGSESQPPLSEETLGLDGTQTGHVLELLERSIGPVPRGLLADSALDDARKAA